MDIGIDLGTTFSVLAVNGKVDLVPGYPAGIYLDVADVTIIPTPYGEQTFPSVVLQDPGASETYLFGSDALQKADEGHAPVMFSKRKIGTSEEIPTPTGPVLAKHVAREFLRCLKGCAEAALGHPVRRAVVTHPAYFDRGQVEETREAAREAGFDMSLPDQMLMEPVAAALTYTRTDPRDPLRVLTYDLGGGTFDVTYLVRNGGVIEMRAFDGDPLLGGYNFDRELIHWLRGRLAARGRTVAFDEQDPEHRARLSQLLRVAEQVKRNLAEAADDTKPVEFRVRGLVRDTEGKDVPINERLSRSDFVQLIAPYLQRTVDACRRTLQKAGVETDEVDELLLVGGSTYGPWIQASVANAFPQVQPKLFFPDLCVGAGAAIHAKMILPPLIAQDGYRLVLEVPDIAVLPTLDVTGRITDAQGDPIGQPLEAALRGPDGAVVRRPVSAEGRFFFPNLELLAEEATQFCLEVVDDGGLSIVEHLFAVRFLPGDTQTSGVTTVLPKPLFIKTQTGFAPLAEEGVSLPARCKRTFQRQNHNPNISLPLYQEGEPIGEIRIENIPTEGGRDSFVDLEVEVTEKNELRGSACIRTPEGKIVIESSVRVAFQIPAVPSVDELRDQLEALRTEYEGRVWSDEDTATALSAKESLHEAQRLLDQQPVERQEIHVALKRVARLLHPPDDEMIPSRREFLQLVGECRDVIREMIEKAKRDAAEVSNARTAKAGDQRGLSETVRVTLARGEQYARLVDKLEVEGIAAHERLDRKTWAQVHDSLTSVLHHAQERVRLEDLPTPLIKAIAAREIDDQRQLLEGQAERLAETGRMTDWNSELDRVRRGLVAVMDEVERVDDGLSGDQAAAIVRSIFARAFQPLKEAIRALGLDVNRVSG